MRAVVFDLDGTLIDSLSTIASAGNSVLRDNGIDPLPEQTYAGFVGWGEKAFLEKLVAHLGLPSDEAARMSPGFMAHYAEAGRSSKLMPGAREALDRLRDANVPLGLCTNKPRAALVSVLESTGLGTCFGAVVAGDDLPVRKPDPAMLHSVLTTLGTDDAVYVGDTPVDSQTAERAGVPFALYEHGIRTVPVTEIPHTFMFSDFSELFPWVAGVKIA